MNNYSKILVIAGNYREFEYWCGMHRINPKHSDPFKYYNYPSSIKGLKLSDVIRYGTWYNRVDIDEDEIIYCLNRQ
jgi:hypothetical protein